MSSNNRIIVAVLVVAALAVAFYVLLLSPKKDENKKLGAQVARQEAMLSAHEAEVQRGLAAEKAFPSVYRQLVVLGKAAPADEETASLLVQVNSIANSSEVRFETIVLNPADSGEAEPPEAQPQPVGGEEISYPSPTEVAASTMPLGASIGPAGLAVMPYTLTFKGSFFHVADFIHGLDSLVKTKNEEVDVTGRLITINGFKLTQDAELGFPHLVATFTVTTFIVPPDQGVTGGATPSSPEPSVTQVSTTTGGTP